MGAGRLYLHPDIEMGFVSSQPQASRTTVGDAARDGATRTPAMASPALRGKIPSCGCSGLDRTALYVLPPVGSWLAAPFPTSRTSAGRKVLSAAAEGQSRSALEGGGL
jgi:hypothetical protein